MNQAHSKEPWKIWNCRRLEGLEGVHHDPRTLFQFAGLEAA